MVEFIQNYGIWIALIGGMVLMHRLGIGCCGGHRHDQDHAHKDAPKRTPTPTETKVVSERHQETAAAGPPHGRSNQ